MQSFLCMITSPQSCHTVLIVLTGIGGWMDGWMDTYNKHYMELLTTLLIYILKNISHMALWLCLPAALGVVSSIYSQVV